MDVVIPLGPGSRFDDIELRFALRSFEQYLPHHRVIIVGNRPAWLQNIVHIPVKHVTGCHLRAQNIYNKIMAAFAISSDAIIFANDDHFMLQHTLVMPYHHKGAMVTHREDSYGRLLQNTLLRYPGCNNFDTHCPIIYHRDLMPVLHKMPAHGIGIKTAYCMENKIAGSFYPDCKISTAMRAKEIHATIEDRQYFSIGDGAFNGNILKVLFDLYPEKSKYENLCIGLKVKD